MTECDDHNTFPDKTEVLPGRRSIVHHGPLSDRVYLMKLKPDDPPEGVVADLDNLARQRSFSKIIAKVPQSRAAAFLTASPPFEVEAEVPGFFSGRESVLFLARFLTSDRRHVDDEAREAARTALRAARVTPETTNTTAGAPTQSVPAPLLPEGFECRLCVERDAEEMAALFRRTFASYPFPLHYPAFVRESITSGSTVYYAVVDSSNAQIVALAGLELDDENKNVEMSDCATHEEYQGKGLASFLLALMDEEAKRRGLKTAYTIARAVSAGMNRTFAKSGYTFAGTLVNNTHISGHIQSMNIWWKDLCSPSTSS